MNQNILYRTCLKGAVLVVFFVVCATTVRAQVSGQDVLEGLGVTHDDKAELEDGGILAYSDKQYESTDRELAADAVVLVKADLDKVHEALKGATTLIPGKVVLDDADIANETDFDGITFTNEEYEEVVKLFRAKPGKDFNFSEAEFAMLDERLRPLRVATRQEQIDAASDAIRDILIGRYQQYRMNGLDGIGGYKRSSRKKVDIGQELLLTTETFLPFEPDFPEFYKVMSSYPEGSDCCEHYFRWLKVEIRDRPTFALSHTMIQSTADFILYTERHYYVSNSLNSVQITMSWLPYADNTYMGLAMSASADVLDSMMGKMLRPIGRNKAKDLVTDVMVEVREILDSDSESSDP